ncbi:MAG: hypothetical protein ACKV2V_23075 [Blastocatellia bacterium]
MKLLLSTILLSALLLVSPITAAPQGDSSAIPPLIASLNLSKGQKKMLEPAYADHYRQVKEVMGGNLSADDKKARLGALNTSINATLSKVLDSKQRKMLNEARARRS